ncbi:MAG: hypothetical protein KDD10_01945 [Phaeodactylibacter sp.]|nr:hypothetical protein [Phaeodactylibacter sp.]MCB9296060.1 hypothetical protein [Lewinellaceae bacterium]
MNNLLFLLLTVFLHAAALAQPASDEQAMRAFTRAYMAAYNRQDVDALRAIPG